MRTPHGYNLNNLKYIMEHIIGTKWILEDNLEHPTYILWTSRNILYNIACILRQRYNKDIDTFKINIYKYIKTKNKNKRQKWKRKRKAKNKKKQKQKPVKNRL